MSQKVGPNNQDQPEEQKSRIKHEKGLGGAAHERGKSFIEATQLILENLSEEQIQNIINANPFPLKKQFEMENSNKDNFELLKQYIESMNYYWSSLDKKDIQKLQGKDLAALERTLIETISKNIYLHQPKSKREKDREQEESKYFNKVKIEIDNAENHVNWKIRESKKTETGNMTRLEEPISTFTPEIEAEWKKILATNILDKPRWFTALPKWEQNYFEKRIKEWESQKDNGIENLGEFLGPVPTTIRKYPGAPNAYVTRVTFKDEGKQEITFTKIRSGVIAPAALKGVKRKNKAKNKEEKILIEQERTKIAKQNLEQLLVVAIQEKIKEISEKPDYKNFTSIPMDLPILLQTLYTPPVQPPGGAKTNKAVMAAFEQVKNELATNNGLNEFLKVHKIDTGKVTFNKVDVLYSNQAVNSGRTLAFLYNVFSKQGSESRKSDKILAKYVNALPNNDQNKMIKAALKSYQEMPYVANTLAATPRFLLSKIFKGASQDSNALSEKAALSQIITGKVGMRVGSCVSGKDREEMITEIAIAQQQFFQKHGEFPPPAGASGKKNKTKRAEFEAMVARQYLTGHGHELAGENSKGCDGLKNIKDVFGEKICSNIKHLAKTEYGINIEIFDPIKDVQKVAGFNKLNTKKLNVSISELKEQFVNSTFYTTLKNGGPLVDASSLVNNEINHKSLDDRLFAIRQILQQSTDLNSELIKWLPTSPLSNQVQDFSAKLITALEKIPNNGGFAAPTMVEFLTAIRNLDSNPGLMNRTLNEPRYAEVRNLYQDNIALLEQIHQEFHAHLLNREKNATLKSDVGVNLDKAPDSTVIANENDDDLLDILTASIPNNTLNEHDTMTHQSHVRQPQQATAPVQQPTVSAHSTPLGITTTVNPNNDPLAVNSPAITPMESLNATAAVANDSQQTINELHTKLKEFGKEKLSKMGITGFSKIEASQGTTAHINIDMVCSKQDETPKITTQVKAETKPGTEGVTYTMKANLESDQKSQTIEQICEMAVRTAKPGTVLSVPTANKDKKEHIEKALNAAFKKVYPEHKPGNFTIPDKPKHKSGLGY